MLANNIILHTKEKNKQLGLDKTKSTKKIKKFAAINDLELLAYYASHSDTDTCHKYKISKKYLLAFLNLHNTIPHTHQENYKYAQNLINNTKQQNNSFNSSKKEDHYYTKLCIRYGVDNVIRQYSSERYPFNCDFYIKSEDLFIELNLHWSHGGHIFDNTNVADLQKLAIWQEKAKTSKYYANAIDVWTIRDLKKIAVAKNNNLNYLMLYKI